MLTMVSGVAGLELRDHAPCGRLPDEKCALQIGSQHAIEIDLLQVEEVGAMNDSGIVDKNVQTAKYAARFGDRVLGIALFADISEDKSTAGGAECVCGRPPRVVVDIGDDNLGALGSIAFGDREPDSPCAAGNDCDFVFELHDELRFIMAKLSCCRGKARPS